MSHEPWVKPLLAKRNRAETLRQQMAGVPKDPPGTKRVVKGRFRPDATAIYTPRITGRITPKVRS